MPVDISLASKSHDALLRVRQELVRSDLPQAIREMDALARQWRLQGYVVDMRDAARCDFTSRDMRDILTRIVLRHGGAQHLSIRVVVPWGNPCYGEARMFASLAEARNLPPVRFCDTLEEALAC